MMRMPSLATVIKYATFTKPAVTRNVDILDTSSLGPFLPHSQTQGGVTLHKKRHGG